MITCWKCKNEITEEEEGKGNYREITTLPGEYRHLHCPEIGRPTNKQISEMRTVLGQDNSESEANPASWIIKH